MSTIVPTQRQAESNILRFESELTSSKELQRRLAFARAWYATLDEDGHWRFAPSKFCGYEGMTAAEYVNDDPRDGRRTEKQLQRWFTIVPQEEPLHDELYEALTSFLEIYQKPPSTAIRLNVAKEYFEEHVLGDSVSRNSALTELIIAVARGLSPDERARVRAAI